METLACPVESSWPTPSWPGGKRWRGERRNLTNHDEEVRDERADDPSDELFVVGIGASAGGLAALKQLFAHVPEDSGIAYVIVVHLSRDHESHLDELLQPHLRIPIHQVTQSIRLERNHVYLVPPNANLDSVDSHLRLSQLEDRRSQRAPIDHFFRTLAENHESRAIGVVLTGMGGDGTLGVQRIKELGGLTIVQAPTEAEFDSMPQSAIAGAHVDLVLPLAEIPSAIVEFVHSAPEPVPQDDEGISVNDHSDEVFEQILQEVRAQTDRDFAHYKRSTLMRRVGRRMQFASAPGLPAYLELLRRQPREVQSLADDLLITVSSFFRDPAVFETLEKDVIPQLFDGKTAKDSIRVWSAGCASGEEAYSLTMLLLEASRLREAPPHIQVFASDLHGGSLQRAREGFYPGEIAADVSPERIARFFDKERGGYRVRKEVRQLVTFSPHNLLSDPPFSRVDLVACRNLLIYLRRDLQRQVVELFHYALRKNGTLLVGASETVDTGDLFRVIDKKHCLFGKRDVPAPEPRLPVFPTPLARPRGLITKRSAAQVASGSLNRQLVERLGPPGLLVSVEDNVVHLSGRGGRYLVHPAGEQTSNLFKLLRPELRVEVRLALSAARQQREVVRSKQLLVSFDGGDPVQVVFDVRPALDPENDGTVLIVFDESLATEIQPVRAIEGHSDDAVAALNLKLEEEKLVTEQHLQVIIEEYETSQEEIRASNEELQSSNEELRSTLEELETSKEELQSMNEELQTVSQENRQKVEELSELSSDLQNLLAATDIATLFLDRELRILRFTPKVVELFNVRMTDRGRHLSDFTSRLGYDGLPKDAATVFDTLVPMEREVHDESGRWHFTRLLPYRSADDRIAGVVITFFDITQRKNVEDELRTSKEHSERIIETLPEPLLVLTSELRVQAANAAFHELFKLGREDVLGESIYALANGQWNIPQLHHLLDVVLPTELRFSGYQLEHRFEELGNKVLLLNGRKSENIVLLGIHDISDRHEAEQALRKSRERLSRMVNVAGVGVLIFDEDDAIADANDTALELLSYDRETLTARRVMWRDLIPSEQLEVCQQQREKLRRTDRIGPYEQECITRDGARTWLLFAGASLGDGTVIEYCIDVNDRKRAEQALRVSEEQLEGELVAMKRLHALVTRLLVCPDLSTALDDILGASMEIATAPMGHIQLLDARRKRLEVVAHRGISRAYLEAQDARSVDSAGPCGVAMSSGQRQVRSDVTADATYDEYRSDAELAGYRSLQATPLVSRSGDVLGVLSTFYPHSYEPQDRDLRLLDLYARQAADFIERITAERVRRSATRLSEENRNKDEYLAMLGHELRNPLAAIRNATELLTLLESDEPRVQRACSVLTRQSTHVSRIIDGLLEVSRIARGKVELHLEPIDVRVVLEGVVRDVAGRASSGDLKFETELGSEPLYVNGDEVRLVQVLDNVIGNATKFTPIPGTIWVSCSRKGEHALIRIRDSGAGIRPEMLERIFDTFRQEKQTPERARGGLGLGLALAKGLTELHGGTIAARSAGLGAGAEFRISLPLTSRRITEQPPQIDAPVISRRVVVVEDNEDAAEMLRELLHLRGHDVRVARDGHEALQILREHGADLVLSDLGLPGMHGYELVESVRTDAKLRHIPLVAVSGYGQSMDRERSRVAGFDDHLVKPVDLQTVDAVVARLGEGRTTL